MSLNSKSNKENMQKEGNSEHMLIGNNGLIQDVELTRGITDLLKENLLTKLAIMEPNLFYLFVLTSENKSQGSKGHSYEDLINIIEGKFRFNENSDYAIEKSLDFLLDSGLFTAKWEQIDNHFERRFYNDNEISKQLAPFKDKIAKGGTGIVKRFDDLCGRMLLKTID